MAINAVADYLVLGPSLTGIDGVEDETEAYLRSKFAKAVSGGTSRKKGRGVRRSTKAVAAVVEKQLEHEATNDAAVPETCQSRPEPVPDSRIVPSPVRSITSGPATRLATAGTEHRTERFCPEGHQLCCYRVSLSCAICDECGLMQRPGEAIFGCPSCDCELCESCVAQTAASPDEANRDLDLLNRVKHFGIECPTVTRFVVSPSGDILDTDHTKSEFKKFPKAHEPFLPPLGISSSCPPSCKYQSCGLMFWAESAELFGYRCGQCNALRSGPRWRCARHNEDVCTTCSPVPMGFSKPRKERNIGQDFDPVPRNLVQPTSKLCCDLLGQFLAEQEMMIQRSRQERGAKPRISRQNCDFDNDSWVDAAYCPPSASSADKGNTADERSRRNVTPDEPRQNHMNENAACSRPDWAFGGNADQVPVEVLLPLKQSMHLTLTLTADFVDELTRGFAEDWYQALVKQCAEGCDHDQGKFIKRVQTIAYQVQQPILENWGFEDGEQGVYDMTCILAQHASLSFKTGADQPQHENQWLQKRIETCLMLMYGGVSAGMLQVSTNTLID